MPFYPVPCLLKNLKHIFCSYRNSEEAAQSWGNYVRQLKEEQGLPNKDPQVSCSTTLLLSITNKGPALLVDLFFHV